METVVPVRPRCDIALVVILACAFLTGALDLFFGMGGVIALLETAVMGVIGYLGLVLARTVGCPELWRRGEKETRWISYILAGATLIFTVRNASNLLSYLQANGPEGIPWASYLLTPLHGILLSLRAGITEEVIFRLFAGPLFVWLLGHVFNNKRTIHVLAIILTTITFSLLVHPDSLIALVASLLMSLIYFRHGLLPAVFGHFFIDAVQFVLASILGLV